MKKLIFLLSAGLVLLTGCGGTDEGAASPSEEKVIRVGAVPDSYPTAFIEDEELRGFSVDMIKAIIEEAGYEIEFVITDWNGVLANLQSGKVDTASNFAATEERGQDYYFTEPYYSSKAVVAAAAEDPQIQSLDDLAGKELASIMGTNFENVLKETFPEEDYELVIYESRDVVYTDVASGRVDGFIFGREQLLAQINDRDIPLQIVEQPFGDQPVAMPFKKTEENEAIISDLNQAVETLREDGTFSDISLEYFGVDLQQDE